jgi:hypothetical protein
MLAHRREKLPLGGPGVRRIVVLGPGLNPEWMREGSSIAANGRGVVAGTGG